MRYLKLDDDLAAKLSAEPDMPSTRYDFWLPYHEGDYFDYMNVKFLYEQTVKMHDKRLRLKDRFNEPLSVVLVSSEKKDHCEAEYWIACPQTGFKKRGELLGELYRKQWGLAYPKDDGAEAERLFKEQLEKASRKPAEDYESLLTQAQIEADNLDDGGRLPTDGR